MPCASPLTQGGRPPSKRNRYSKAMPAGALGRQAERLVEQRAQVLVVVLACHSPLALPNVPSHWICRPWPG